MSGRRTVAGSEPIERAVAELRSGRPVVVVDDVDRENEGDLVLAGVHATPEWLAFIIRHSSGVVCVPMEAAELDRLALPPMTGLNEDRKGTAFTVSVDVREGISSGISAADRARTIVALADPSTRPSDLSRPGHVFPLRAAAGGVLQRAGHTEAAVDLVRLAGLRPVGVIGELVADDGSMARLPELQVFAARHGLSLVSVRQLIDYRRRTERLVERVADTRLPTAHGTFRAIGYRDSVDGIEHIALVVGDVTDGHGILVRVHSECLTGDVFSSRRCDCGQQLGAALDAVTARGRGVVVYLRGHEGRGIGLAQKLRAYERQDEGSDTLDANLELGLPADARDYGTAAQILRDLGVRSVQLLTNNPAKVAAMEHYGLTVQHRVALPPDATRENLHYLYAKRDRMGHQLPNLPDPGWDPALEGSPT